MEAIAVALVAGSALLVVIGWRSRTALAGLLGVVGFVLAGSTILSGPAARAGEYMLAGAGAALALGSALYGIGRALQRLLDREPDDTD
jgi:hypothetical protein